MIRIVSVLLLTSILLSSCNGNLNNKNNTSEVTIEKINKLEKELFDSGLTTINTTKARQLCDLYVEYANTYPEDSISPELLYKAADINMNVNDPKSTIALFNKIVSTYPKYKNIPTIIFLRGYVYENQLQDYNKAKQSYLELLRKYPNSDFADDATISIKNLGKSPEEMIEVFESNNKTN